MKKRRKKHAVKKLPAGRAHGAEGQTRSAQSTGGRRGYYPENEPSSDGDTYRFMALWRAVFAQAVMDAKSRRTKQEYGYIRNTALFWLLHNQADFNMVCDFAGFDPASARRRVRDAQERGFIWRAGDGQQPTKHERGAPRDFEIIEPEISELAVKPRRNSGANCGQLELAF